MLEHVIFGYGDTADTWSFLDQYAELRRQKFVEQLSWDLWSNGRIELDQYDNPNTVYSLVRKDGRIVAGARLIPADLAWCGWRNLLADSEAGRIDAIPPGLFPAGYDFSGTWECSRLVILSDLKFLEGQEALRVLVAGLVWAAQERGARALLSLSPPSLARSLRRSGYEAQTIGDSYTCGDDGRKYSVLEMPVPRIPA